MASNEIEFNPGGATSLAEATALLVDAHLGSQDWRNSLKSGSYDPETETLTLVMSDDSEITIGGIVAGGGGGGGVSTDVSDLPGFTSATRIVFGTQADYDGRTPPADDDTIFYNIVGDA